MKINSMPEARALTDKCARMLARSNTLQLPVATRYCRLAQKCLQRNGYAVEASVLNTLIIFSTDIWPPSS